MSHRYSFNDGTARDSVGNANGVLSGGATVVNGQLYFDPAVNNGGNNPLQGQYVALPYNVAHTSSFAIEVWATDRVAASWQRLFDMGNQIGTIGVGFQMMATFGYAGQGVFGQVSINSSGSSSDTNYVTTTTLSSLNVEHQYVYDFDLSRHVETIWQDGALLANNPAVYDPSTTNYTNFWIGRSQFFADPYFDGTINELRVYDTGLIGPQIAASYAAGPNGVPEPSAVVALAAVAMLGRRRVDR